MNVDDAWAGLIRNDRPIDNQFSDGAVIFKEELARYMAGAPSNSDAQAHLGLAVGAVGKAIVAFGDGLIDKGVLAYHQELNDGYWAAVNAWKKLANSIGNYVVTSYTGERR